ncbi:hypothetical protein M885DRAFT_570419 [Pelagophyceae sp. CCMP2097]|nr:hypothetical protein M885DRAFT_570419 [Pelagophyceae sp. CCMP2097]
MEVEASFLRPCDVEAAAVLLSTQWPSNPLSARRRDLAQIAAIGCAAAVPTHVVLLVDGGVVAYARLQKSAETADGRAAVLTSVVVAASSRKRGLGRKLVAFAERTAADCGFGYVQLWTTDAEAFYAKAGYAQCDRVAIERPALANRNVSALEGFLKLQQRSAGDVTAATPKDVEGAMWMKKRVRERCADAQIDVSRDALISALRADAPLGQVHVAAGGAVWERQVGPSCGLAALRSAGTALRRMPPAPHLGAPRHFEAPPFVDGRLQWDARALKAGDLLSAAVELGCSIDGEVFDIHALVALAQHAGHERVFVTADLDDIVAWLQEGGVCIVAYDRAKSDGHRPVCTGGKGAHYLLLLGVETHPGPPEKTRLVGLHGITRTPRVTPSTETASSNAETMRRLVVDFEALKASNAQLDTLRPGDVPAAHIAKGGPRLARKALLLAR